MRKQVGGEQVGACSDTVGPSQVPGTGFRFSLRIVASNCFFPPEPRLSQFHPNSRQISLSMYSCLQKLKAPLPGWMCVRVQGRAVTGAEGHGVGDGGVLHIRVPQATGRTHSRFSSN